MENIIILAVVALILGLAIGYIHKARKNGARCVGCSASCGCSCGCGGCKGK